MDLFHMLFKIKEGSELIENVELELKLREVK